jgi:hypothetical protein
MADYTRPLFRHKFSKMQDMAGYDGCQFAPYQRGLAPTCHAASRLTAGSERLLSGNQTANLPKNEGGPLLEY